MKKYIKLILPVLLLAVLWTACKKNNPVDEDGLLITERTECAVTNFDLLGSDFVTVRSKPVSIDTTAQTINVEVQFGTDLKNLYPQFSLSNDAKLNPKIVGKVDFSDLSNPKVYTVISGNRQIRKDYTIFVTVQPR